MQIEEIEQLVSIVRGARISELTVSVDGSTVRLRKPLPRVQPASAGHAARPAGKPASAAAEAKPTEPAAAESFVIAPMVGIFHSAGKSMAPGVTIKAGQSVGAIESMKLMNDVISDRDGVIAEVLVEDGVPVEYGQPIFRLEVA